MPVLVEQYLAGDVHDSAGPHTASTWPRWPAGSAIPGGPKVIEAIEATLGLDPDALEITWRSLAEVGNLSSASVLHVLADTLAKRELPAGQSRAC